MSFVSRTPTWNSSRPSLQTRWAKKRKLFHVYWPWSFRWKTPRIFTLSNVKLNKQCCGSRPFRTGSCARFADSGHLKNVGIKFSKPIPPFKILQKKSFLRIPELDSGDREGPDRTIVNIKNILFKEENSYKKKIRWLLIHFCPSFWSFIL